MFVWLMNATYSPVTTDLIDPVPRRAAAGPRCSGPLQGILTDTLNYA